MSVGKRDPADLILQIHAAPLDQAAWASVVEQVRVALHARAAILHTPFVRSFEDYWCFSTQIDAAQLETYARDWMAGDLWTNGARRRGLYETEGLVCMDDALVERRRFRQSSFFHELLKRNDMDRMVTVNLHRGNDRRGVVHTQLSVFSGVGQQPFSSESVELLEQIKPHLMLASRNYCVVRSLQDFNATAGRALDGLAAALVALDRKGRMILANRPAEQLLQSGEWLASVDGKLTAGSNIRNPEACAAALKQLTNGIGATVLLERFDSGAERILLTTPAGPEGGPDPPLAANVSGLVWVLPERPAATAVDRLAQLFDMTPAETRLLARLAVGDDLKSVASGLGVSIHTARNQLKSVLRKSGRHSQAQLLALLNRMAVL